MAENRDIEGLLRTGMWTSQRAILGRTPCKFDVDNKKSSHDHRSHLVWANQPQKLDSLEPNDPKIPRSFSYFSYKRFPPPPSVEDEKESIAKEYNPSITGLSKEEPQCKGDKDQFPIILPAPEHNLERRFVLVARPETDDGNISDGQRPLAIKTEANPRIQLEPKTKTEGIDTSPPQRQRSRARLPRIETDSGYLSQSRPSEHAHGSRSATYIHQDHRDASPRDYFSSQPEPARPLGEPFLTPSVKHGTKSRGRAYWDFTSGATRTGSRDVSLDENPRSADNKELNSYAQPRRPACLAANRRLHSDMEVPELRKSFERGRDESYSRARNGPLSPSSDFKRSPPRLSRRETSPVTTRAGYLGHFRDRPNHHGRSVSPYNPCHETSSDESNEHTSHRCHREHGRSTVSREDRTAFLSAPGPQHVSKSRSRPPSPLPSPTPPQERYLDRKAHPSSSVFGGTRPTSPTSSESSPSPRSRSRFRAVDDRSEVPSRAPSMRSNAAPSKPLGSSVVSYRRYSEDVSAGALPDLPDCPRKKPRAGYTDWLTLPRNDNFNVCPSCYEQVFYPSEFRDLLVLAPLQRMDKALVCDFGTSPWYRIAWLMTRKYRRSDLRLLQGISDVSLKNKTPCYGPVRATRIWHSILNPETRRCIASFKVCTPCAESVQVLFPSLTGVFVPLDRLAEPRSGQCSLHFAPHRTRFLTYFDILEDTHDRAMARNTTVNIQRLVERIDSWAGVDECPGDEPLRHRSWYTMANVPEMTLCKDCFLSIVYPALFDEETALANGTSSEGPALHAVARAIRPKPQLMKSATVCQMSSPWMKELFQRACKRHDGVAYLESKVRAGLRLP